MSDSKQFQALIRQAPYLWVTNVTRAVAFLVAVFIIIMPFVVIEALEPWHLARSINLSGGKADMFLRVTKKLAVAAAGEEDIVLVSGGSAARELTPHDEAISQDLTRLCGRKITVINAGTAGQKFSENWAITTSLPNERVKLIIIGFNYARLHEGFADVHRSLFSHRFAMNGTTELADFISTHGFKHSVTPPTLSQIVWLHRKLQTAGIAWYRSDADLSSRDTVYDRYQSPDHLYSPPGKSLEEKKAIAARILAERALVFEALHEQGTELWKFYATHVLTHKAKMLFLAMPESSVMQRTRQLFATPFDGALRELGLAGATVVDWRRDHGLNEDDFFDQGHLLAAGRRKLEPKLLKLIASQLAGCAAPELSD